MKTNLLLAASLFAALALPGCGDNTTPPPAKPVANAPATTGEASAQTEADSLLTQAQTYIKEQKWDMADQAVAKLDDLKPKLPAEYGPRIDQLKQAIATAKSAAGSMGGVKLPGQ